MRTPEERLERWEEFRGVQDIRKLLNTQDLIHINVAHEQQELR